MLKKMLIAALALLMVLCVGCGKGKEVVVDNGDNTVTVEFDVWDDADYNITGRYTGTYAVAQPSSLSATRSGAKKIANSLVVAEQKPARSKESFRVVKPAQKSEKKAVKKGLNLR